MKKLNFTENGNFTMVPNGILRSGKLSAKALGVYFLIVSLPDNWNFSVKGLCTLCSDGYNAVSSAVRELEEAGFLKRKPRTGENGRFSECEWEIECKPLNENPSTEKPSSDEPSADEPSSENQPQLNTKQQKTKQTNTKQVKDSSYELYAALGVNNIKTAALMDKKAVKEKEIRRKNPPESQCLFCENRKNPEEYADYFPQERQIKF